MIVLACLLYFKLTAGPELVADGIHVRLQRVSIHAADRFTSATSTVYLVRVLITNQSTSNYSYNAYNFQLQGPDAAVYRPNVGYARAPLLYGTVGPGQSVAGDLAFATPPAQQFSLLWQPIYGATPLSLALPQP